jgi:uncharacterized membrane protein SpoIIM required for sporulation/ABC-type transport system involved in multi-copper enzyme maturation permease subunit
MMAGNLHPVWVVARREIRDQFRDWRIIFPIFFLTIFFPFLMNFTAQQMLGFVREFGADIVGERLIPFLLMIVGFFPISVSLVIALESFVGEKERGSIEPLLCSPLKDWQLYVGKLLSSTVPPLVGSFMGMVIYLSGLAISQVTLPEVGLLIQIFILTIVHAIVMVSGAVVVSTQATSVRAANLLASFIVIPMALLVQAESVVMFWGRDTLSLWWIILGLVVLAGLLVRVGLAHFQREELLGREIDVLNFRWGWRVFWQEFSDGTRNILTWYLRVIPRALVEMRWSILAVLVIASVSIIIGASQADVFPIQLPDGRLSEGLEEVLGYLPLSSTKPVVMIFWQNTRVLFFGMVLGIFSFGVLGVLPILATMGISGYLIQILANNGISAERVVLGLFAPHGIIEIPAIIVATAAVLRIGVLLATPKSGKTVGEVFIRSIATWTKIMVGFVFPLLLASAAVEAWITPRIAIILLR